MDTCESPYSLFCPIHEPAPNADVVTGISGRTQAECRRGFSALQDKLLQCATDVVFGKLWRLLAESGAFWQILA